MRKNQMRDLLQKVETGKISVEQALKTLEKAQIDDLGFARIDLSRKKRCGLPEVVYCPNKTPQQIIDIVRSLNRAKQNILCSRIEPDVAAKVRRAVKGLKYNPDARMLYRINEKSKPRKGKIMVVCAGTSDLPVAEEAALTAEFLGNSIERAYDVGVAGIHRLLAELDSLRQARVIIVCAGMEGALPSVVAGLVDAPVIAVPTSVGYGAAFGGLAALLAMLNACASSVAVMNIDNGFGAACFANAINIQAEGKR